MITTFSKITTKKGNTHEVKIVFGADGRLSEKSGCTCRYGSFYRWSKANKRTRWTCRHIVQEYGKKLKISYASAREILIKQKILDKDHIKRE